jgi:hypothetical protein
MIFKAENLVHENRFLAVRNEEAKGSFPTPKKKGPWIPRWHPEPKLCDVVVTGLSFSIS